VIDIIIPSLWIRITIICLDSHDTSSAETDSLGRLENVHTFLESDDSKRLTARETFFRKFFPTL
jgi:hypothetical protein